MAEIPETYLHRVQGALDRFKEIDTNIKAGQGALVNMQQEMPDNVDLQAVHRFEELQKAAEQVGDPALLALLYEAREILDEEQVQEWIALNRESQDAAAKELIKELEVQQKRAEDSYKTWLAKQQEHQAQLDREREALLKRQQQLVESTQEDTKSLDCGADKDFVAEAKKTSEYAQANTQAAYFQEQLDLATKALETFNADNEGMVADYKANRQVVDAATQEAIKEPSQRQTQALALMSGSLRPETGDARTEVQNCFTKVEDQQALVTAIRGVAPVRNNVAMQSLLNQYDAAEGDLTKRAQLCAEMAIHLHQDPTLSKAWVHPAEIDADAMEPQASEALRAQVERIHDVEHLGQLRLRNSKAIAELASSAGVKDNVCESYDKAVAVQPKYDHYLALTAKRDGLKSQYYSACHAKERVISEYVASTSVHAAVIDGRQAVEAAGPELADVFAPQIASLKVFEAKLNKHKDKDSEIYKQLVASPEATKLKKLAGKLKDVSQKYVDYKTKHDFIGMLRQGNTRTMSTGYVTNIKTRDGSGNEVIWGRLAATQSNSQQTLYGGKRSFLWQHLGSTLRTMGMAMGVISTPLQAYRAATKKAAAEQGFKLITQRDAAGKETGLFRFVSTDGSNRPATAREHSRILQRASGMTAEMGGRYHMHVQQYEVDGDTSEIEREGALGLDPTPRTTPGSDPKQDPSKPTPLNSDNRRNLQHRLNDSGAEAEQTYGPLVNDIQAQLSGDKHLLVLTGTGFNFGNDGEGIAIGVTSGNKSGEYRLAGGDSTRGFTFKENSEGRVEFFDADGHDRLNNNQVKAALANVVVKQPEVTILRLTADSKTNIMKPSDPSAQAAGVRERAVGAPEVPGAGNRPVTANDTPAPTG